MMTNLFSIFDPSLSLFSFSWMIMFLSLAFIPSFLWPNSSFSLFFKNLSMMWVNEVNYSISSPKKGVYKLITSIFLLLVLYNFLALFPFIFSSTSHLSVTFPLAYSLWVGIIFFTLFKSFKDFLVHLIPAGTPLGLMSFMVLIEIMSNLIRPMALTFRLTANMMAGHLLMSLIGSAVLSLPFLGLMVGASAQMLLVFMELGVSMIQAYVFSTLLLLYLSEAEASH